MGQDSPKCILVPTSFPPIASNIFSSCTRSCCVLFMRMQGWGERESGSDFPPPLGDWEMGVP